MRFVFLKRGFTLIELLVVIAIIGILASIVLVSVNGSRAKGRDAKRIADIRTIQLALEEYYNDNASYPTALSSLQPNYISNVPTDPSSPGTPYSYVTWNSTNTQICTSNKPIGYHLGAGLEDSTNSALQQDADAGPRTSTQDCGGGADFAGRGKTVNYACASTYTLGDVETCYDVTN